jgi:prophage regulatory protein
MSTNEEILRKLNDIQRAVQLSVKEILTIDEAAISLGLAKSYIYKLTCLKQIPYYKNGRKVYFRKSELEDWMTCTRIATNQELMQEANKF